MTELVYFSSVPDARRFVEKLGRPASPTFSMPRTSRWVDEPYVLCVPTW